MADALGGVPADAPSAEAQRMFIQEWMPVVGKATCVTILRIVYLEMGRDPFIENGATRHLSLNLDKIKSAALLYAVYRLVYKRREVLSKPVEGDWDG